MNVILYDIRKIINSSLNIRLENIMFNFVVDKINSLML